MRPLVLGALLLLAGCVAPVEPVTPEQVEEATAFVDPIVADHDHTDPTAHAYAWNLAQTAHHPLAGSASRSAYAHALEVRGEWLFVATWGDPVEVDGGVWIFSLADPEKPEPVGRWRHPGSLNGDLSMKPTADGDFFVVSTEPLTSFGQVSPFGPGLYLVDARDKSAPRLAHYQPGPGTHSVTIHTIGGRDIVFTAATRDMNTIYEIVRAPLPHLRAIGTLPIGESSIVVDDPLLGGPALYASNGHAGYEVYDIATPERPRLVGTWNIPDRGDRYYIHTSAVEFVDGRRIVVVTSEDWTDYPSTLWILDATDLSSIEILTQWTNPGGHAADDIRFSLHNPRLVDGTLWLSHYHAGVWALDISTPEKRAAPEVRGVFIPGEDVGTSPLPPLHGYMRTRERGFSFDSSPLVLDVAVHEGVVYAADVHTGLYAIKPAWT